jgi:hypothetical protein
MWMLFWGLRQKQNNLYYTFQTMYHHRWHFVSLLSQAWEGMRTRQKLLWAWWNLASFLCTGQREKNLSYTLFKTMNHHRWHLAVSNPKPGKGNHSTDGIGMRRYSLTRAYRLGVMVMLYWTCSSYFCLFAHHLDTHGLLAALVVVAATCGGTNRPWWHALEISAGTYILTQIHACIHVPSSYASVGHVWVHRKSSVMVFV